MIRPLHILPLATLLLSTAACGSSEKNDVKISRRDTPAYELGRDDARRLLREAHTQSDVCDFLLEVRAREYEIGRRGGVSSAEAYAYGFKSALIESGDTLAATLFDQPSE